MAARPLMLAAAMGSMVAAPALAASGNAASATGMASATIVQPIAVAELADLDFGNVASDGDGAVGAGSVTVAPAITGATYTGSSRNACDTGLDCPDPHAARFVVTGEVNRAYTITVPAELTITPRPLAHDTTTIPAALVVDSIQVRTASRPGDGPAGLLDTAGHDYFEIGGRLQLPASLPPARYSTAIQVVVTYS